MTRADERTRITKMRTTSGRVVAEKILVEGEPLLDPEETSFPPRRFCAPFGWWRAI